MAAPTTISVPGVGDVHAIAGDWIEIAVSMRSADPFRSHLGPPITRARLEALVSTQLDDTQLIFRPAPSAPLPALSRPSGRESGPCPFAVIIVETPEQARLALAGLPEESSALLIDLGVICPAGPEALGARLAKALCASGSSAAFATFSRSEPTSLPASGLAQSPTARLPGGRSIWEVYEQLADCEDYDRGCPANPGAVLLSPAAARLLAQVGRVDVADDCVTVPAAFGWRDSDSPGLVAGLVGTSGGAAFAWQQIAEVARAKVARPVLGRPHVALYTAAIGAWGGVAVLMRLADELQGLGAHAFVVHHHTATIHDFPTFTAPLKVRSANLLAQEWRQLVGEHAFLVPSNWGAGKVARDVARLNPGVVLSSILQDREDLFETKDGRETGMGNYGSFLGLGEGVSVSRWIIDSAAKDIGLQPRGYRVIPNGVDAKLFRPRLGERPGGPVRVLGMWRPQTEVRRGIKLLRETFDTLRVRFGDEVSLELFGWDVPQGPSKAPSYARHHGVLTPRGVGDLMRSVDIVVEPSLYQGFGLSGLEAMASGAVLVSTACRGVDEYATHDENALVVPHADLAAAVGRAIEDRDLRARLRQAGIETAPRFAWPVIGARWALYLADLAERRGARALVAGMERVVGRARDALDKKDHG